MRSLGSRVVLEWALRAAAVGAVVLAWRDGTRPDAAGRRVVPAGALAAVAPTLTLADTLQLSTDTLLDAVWRAELAARRDAGAMVRWSGAVDPLVATLDREGEPAGRVRLAIAAPSGQALSFRDALGPIDSLAMIAPAMRVQLAPPSGALTLTIGRQGVPLPVPARDSLRSVVLLARAGWEAKFVAAALEEAGWPVTLRLVVRPDTATAQGRILVDPARTDVVIALDETAAPWAAAMTRFVQEGGGVVLGPAALSAASFRGMAPGRAGARVLPEMITIDTVAPRRALARVPMVGLAPDAVVIERIDGAIAVAARRLGRGRVVGVGVEDSWRWRMTGPDGAPAAHRAWWSALVAAARGDGNLSAAGRVRPYGAPRVAMVAALGAPTDPPPARPAAPPDAPARGRWPLVAIGALLLEWASRRWRGAR